MAKAPLPCSYRPSKTLTLLSVLLSSLLRSYAQENPTFLWCPYTSNYTTTSQFKRNLDRLLINLTIVPATDSPGHFHSASVGDADAAYGLVQCGGDVLSEDCAACLRRTAKEVVSLCALGRVAAIRYDDCLLRYSNLPIYGIVEKSVIVRAWNVQNTTDRVLFDKRLTELLREISSVAAEGSSRFAVGIKNNSEVDNIYGLAQCTRDLSTWSCKQCLWALTGSLERWKIGGAAVSASCFLRFEIRQFFDLSFVPPPPSVTPLPPFPPPPAAVGSAPTSPSSVPPPADGDRRNSRERTSKTVALSVGITSAVVVASIALGIIVCFKRTRRAQRTRRTMHQQPTDAFPRASLAFDLEVLKAATGNFCEANKVGEGGFGSVYKGVLPDGQNIAVKKLRRMAEDGLVELKNEVALLAKLEHRNLARLVGYCLEEEHKMVIYEYLPNASLDKLLFDPVKRLLLNWERRYNLIEGITRGLVYLHEESRIRIIHRDLKASNVLLDEHMNPKISDFGLAKVFAADETHRNTKRIAGTLGYMPPEYALNGHFSTKVDVFGFGVLVLEIVTGRRIGEAPASEAENGTNLLRYVWHHWNEETPLRVLDHTVVRYRSDQVLRCIHIALLCVQQNPSRRPNMSTVGLMLSSASMVAPRPSRPAFLGEESENTDASRGSGQLSLREYVPPNESPRGDLDRQRRAGHSMNQVTVSDVVPR